MKIAIVCAKWNSDITDVLSKSCEERLLKSHVEVVKYSVAGAVELPVMAKNIIIHDEQIEAVICIGVVIKGETDHYEFVANQASYGCQKVAIETSVPVIFGVLTTQNKTLAMKRANGEHSFSGVEWAETAIQMAENIQNLIAVTSLELIESERGIN